MISKFLASSGSVVVLALSWTQEITAITPAVIAAVLVGLVNLYVARTARLLAMKDITKAIKPVEDKVDAIVPVVAKIEGHVNSETTRNEGVIAAHKLENALQREMIEEMKKAASLLAQAKASADMSVSVAQAAIAGAMMPAKKEGI